MDLGSLRIKKKGPLFILRVIFLGKHMYGLFDILNIKILEDKYVYMCTENQYIFVYSGEVARSSMFFIFYFGHLSQP